MQPALTKTAQKAPRSSQFNIISNDALQRCLVVPRLQSCLFRLRTWWSQEAIKSSIIHSYHFVFPQTFCSFYANSHPVSFTKYNLIYPVLKISSKQLGAARSFERLVSIREVEYIRCQGEMDCDYSFKNSPSSFDVAVFIFAYL